MKKVSLVSASSYDEAQDAVDKSLANLGGLGAYFSPGQRVLIKANLLGKHAPEKAVTTHPALIEALARRLVEFGCKVVIGDSPAGAYTEAKLAAVYKATGMSGAAESSGAELNYDCGFREVETGGLLLRKIEMISVALGADAIINFCKLKTHEFTGYSGCTKNLYGVVPGRIKIQLHAAYSAVDKFCDMLIDIERFLADRIKLHFIDGIIGMDGAGPLDGNPHFVGKVLASPDPYLCDLAALKIVGAGRESMPLIERAAERGLIDMGADIETVGESLADTPQASKYKSIPVRLHEPIGARVPRFLLKPAYKLLTKYPRLKRKRKCVGCRKCKEHCPVDAIEIKKGKAKFDLVGCIRCFCCSEVCEFHAIKIVTPLLYKTMRK